MNITETEEGGEEMLERNNSRLDSPLRVSYFVRADILHSATNSSPL
jgi:hypothetical protein